MKKWVSMIAAGAAAVSLLAGCGAAASNTAQTTAAAKQTTKAADGAGAEAETKETETAAASSVKAEETASGEASGAADGKTLVVYYSATGNTKAVAESIAAAAGADLFELEPTEPYTSEDLNWTDEGNRVSVEHENEEQREVELVSTTVDNWDSYDTVFIGYPIWWGIAAWPVDGFVKDNDFTGKTVIPFATSSSSGMGESGNLFAELAGTGDWQEGMRFRSGASADDVTAWVEELGLAK